ncbi:PEPxxWA-CTERM sorting domain-containing protein [Qipengyuania sp.]|uniref:PEPxxWA-CTERM sorting domain-containing protein n=1 Tax=Qipengyuania sp. TaxID=2004515 RepID=UPI0035C7D522
MNFKSIRGLTLGGAAILGVVGAVGAAPATAAPVLRVINQDLQSNPYQFCYMGGCFNFTAQGFTGFGEILGVRTSGSAAVTATPPIFGSVLPSVSFVDRGTVTYGPPPEAFGYYASFDDTAFARFSNNDNFLGLRVTSNGQDYYGFAYTTNQTLNGIGFETLPGTVITATTDFSGAAVPEPATWAMLILGFGTIGGAMRARRRGEGRFATA